MSFFAELKRRNVIRVGIAYALIAWVVLQAADFGLDLIDAPNWVIQALFMLAVIGLPTALLIAWVFELTPEGIKREKDVDRSESITPQTRRKLDLVIVGALVLAVAYLLTDKLLLQDRANGAGTAATATVSDTPAGTSSETTPARASVAVLPFVNMSDDQQNEYFSDGLTETLLHMLAQLPDLQVAARTSSFAFKNQNRNVADIAATLGVAHILEGSVQKAGDRVRVTAQLVRADDGFHVWSQKYTRPLQDIFAIQDEIATDVAGALGASLLGTRQSTMKGIHTANLNAYDSYLKGLEEQALFSYASLPLARNHFKQALAQDPEFSEAHLALVKNYLLELSTGLIDQAELQAAVPPLLRQARQLEPDDPHVRAAELLVELATAGPGTGARGFGDIIDELRKLLAVIPTETYVRLAISNHLSRFLQDNRGAEEVLSAGLLIDPLEDKLHAALGEVYTSMGDLERAAEALRRSLELEPGNPNTYWSMRELEQRRGNITDALDWGRQAVAVDPQDHEFAAEMASDFYHLELPEEGDRWNARVQALAPRSSVARALQVQRAIAWGEEDRAIELAEHAIRDRIDDRRGAFGDILFSYLDLMSRQGRAAEAVALMSETDPAIARYEQVAGSFESILMQWLAVLVQNDFMSQEQQRENWNAMAAHFDALGFPWRDPKDMGITTDLLINGDTEGAIEAMLSGPLTEPIALYLGVRRQLLPGLYEPLYSDPRIAARYAELEAQFQQLRLDVVAMLQQPEWSP